MNLSYAGDRAWASVAIGTAALSGTPAPRPPAKSALLVVGLSLRVIHSQLCPRPTPFSDRGIATRAWLGEVDQHLRGYLITAHAVDCQGDSIDAISL